MTASQNITVCYANNITLLNEIALKECFESEYWLELLFETGYLVETQYKKLNNDCGTIRKMLISSCKTLKAKKWIIFLDITIY